MNPWAAKRKSVTFIIFVFFIILFVVLPVYFFSKNVPVCDNKIQDGDEGGVDCGGTCALLCKPETLPLITRGEARVLRIASSTYVTSVLIENPNLQGVVERAPYKMMIYTAGTKEPVKVFEKETYIGPSSTFGLFLGPFKLPGTGPFRAVFEWGNDLVWKKSGDTTIISVEGMNFIRTASSSQRLEANLTNRSTNIVNNIEVVAILSDVDGNTIASGKSFVDSIASGESVPVSFTWPESFVGEPVNIRILPHPLPDKSYIR